jgi:hypothetical protein
MLLGWGGPYLGWVIFLFFIFTADIWVGLNFRVGPAPPFHPAGSATALGGSHGALVPPEREIVLLLALAMTRSSRWRSSLRNRTARKPRAAPRRRSAMRLRVPRPRRHAPRPRPAIALPRPAPPCLAPPLQPPHAAPPRPTPAPALRHAPPRPATAPPRAVGAMPRSSAAAAARMG